MSKIKHQTTYRRELISIGALGATGMSKFGVRLTCLKKISMSAFTTTHKRDPLLTQ
jgi:hypothetical protein